MPLHRELDGLTPSVANQADAALQDLKAQGIGYYVNETVRELVVQMAYYVKGRLAVADVQAFYRAAGLVPPSNAEAKTIVTWTLESKHIAGRALDVVPSDDNKSPLWSAPDYRWSDIARVMKAHGFKWGGDWKDHPDTPHYEM